jgi:hypothetical protein
MASFPILGNGGLDMQRELQAIAQNGPTPEARQQAQQMLQALAQNPSLADQPSFQQAFEQVKYAGTAPGAVFDTFNKATGAPTIQQHVETATRPVGAPISRADWEQLNPTPEQQQDKLVQQLIDNAQGQVTGRKNFVDQNVMPALSTERNANAAAMFGDQQRADDIAAASSKFQNTLSGLSAEQRGLASGYNAAGAGMYGSYAAGQNALNQRDDANLSRYMSETDPLMQQLTARNSNPQDIANQQAALQAATGIANGSLDYQAAQAALTQAALSQYYSNPADQQRQLDAYGNLSGIGRGNLDYQSQAARAYADDTDLANQRKALSDIQADVAGGNKEQLAALDLIKSRTGNTATAEEAFLAEQARRKFESDDRNSREAVMHDLSMRGLRSGSAEIANQLAEREQLSQDRTLSELGLQANAMQRARAYTGMQADQANAMRNSAQNALGLQGNLSTAMRNASFDEAYKRGVGADTASANNQQTRLTGSLGAANQSNAIRNANDTVGMFNTGQANQVSMFNAGQANDVSMFNTGQTNQARANNQSTRLAGTQLQANQSNEIRNANDAMIRFQDQFAQNEATRVGNLATDRSQQNLNTTQQEGTRNDTTYQKGKEMLDTNYGRDTDSISLDARNAPLIYGADTDVANAKNDVTTNAADRASRYTGSTIAATGTAYPGDPNQDLINALMLGVGSSSKKSAKGILGGY